MAMKTARKKKPALRSQGLRAALQIWILVVTAALLNINTLGNGFTLDDRTLVLEDPRTSGLDHIGEIITGGYRISQTDSLYRPLTVLSLALNRVVTGEGAFGFHLVNLGLHLIAVLLVFLLGREIFRDRHSSLIAALVFAVHPVHVEAVANIVGRAEIMAAISVLGSLILLLRASRKKWSES